MATKNRRKFTQCPNCGYTFEEVNNYCPNCGQENHDLNVPVKHLLGEFLEGTLHYDNKFWVTLKYLMLRPGLLTEKFNIGQRASYVPPFRLYVFVSIFFFTAIALFASDSMVVEDPNDVRARLETTDPGAAAQIGVADSIAAVVGGRALSRDTKDVQTTEGEMLERFQRFVSNKEQSRQKLLKNVSFMMFVLMPFFGFILYLFYRRQGRNYVEHLMFSIHFHTFVFLLIIAAIILELIIKGLDTNGWVFLISMVYLFFALHRVYKQSYVLTIAKLIPLFIVYMVSLVMLFLSTVAVSVWLS